MVQIFFIFSVFDKYLVVNTVSTIVPQLNKASCQQSCIIISTVPAIVRAAKAADSQWLIVEQDQPSMGKTPMECAAMSMEYLKGLKK